MMVDQRLTITRKQVLHKRKYACAYTSHANYPRHANLLPINIKAQIHDMHQVQKKEKNVVTTWCIFTQ